MPSPSHGDPIRVYFLTGTSDRGGAETLLAQLLQRIDRVKFEVRVDSGVGAGWLTEQAGELGVVARNFTGHSPFFIARAIRSTLRTWRPHVVHAFGLRMETIARLSLRMPGSQQTREGTRHGATWPAYISVAHSPDPWRKPLHTLLDRATAGVVDQFVAVGQTVAESRIAREKVPAEKMLVIPNGVDPPAPAEISPEARAAARRRIARQFGFPPEDAPLLLMVGNLREMKGHGEALRALKQLRVTQPRARLLVVGKDVSDGRYAALARELGVADAVTWAGYQERPGQFLPAADVYLMPSYWEGSPTALLEAMAAGLPSVASNIGGIAELAREGRDALLVPPREWQPLAAALEKISSDAEFRARLGVSARGRVMAHFTIQKMVRAHEQLYEKWAAQGHKH